MFLFVSVVLILKKKVVYPEFKDHQINPQKAHNKIQRARVPRNQPKQNKLLLKEALLAFPGRALSLFFLDLRPLQRQTP
jgi:hypothetical protein